MPIAIGSLTDVPAPGDPIRSPWAQGVTRLGVHVFANKATMDAQWTSPPDGAHAWTIAEQRHWLRIAGVWYRYPDFGVNTGASDANGFVVVTHALGKTPSQVLAISGLPSGAGAYTVQGISTISATTISIRTTLLSATVSNLRWMAWP